MEPVTIGAREIYDALVELKGEMYAWRSGQTTEIALLKKDVENLKANGDRRWKLNLALASAFVSPIVAVVLPLTVR